MTGIGDSAFEGCSSLTGITFPSGVTAIGANAIPEHLIRFGEDHLCVLEDVLVKCEENAESVIIPDRVRLICIGAFCEGDRLRKVTIPKGVKVIKKSAFHDIISVRFLLN